MFDLLRGLASGPNLENQLSVAATDILSCVNRIMSYCEYTSVSDVDYAGADNEAAKGQLLSQVSYVLLALLEGVPDPVVVRRMVSAVDWTHFARHLKVLKLLIEDGILEAHDEEDSEKKKKKKKKKRQPAGTQVPLTTSDPKSDRCAKWLEKEAFRFYSIVEKLRIVGTELEANPDPDDDDALRAMAPVFTDVETQNFYQDRVGQVEVVRDGGLERLLCSRTTFETKKTRIRSKVTSRLSWTRVREKTRAKNSQASSRERTKLPPTLTAKTKRLQCRVRDYRRFSPGARVSAQRCIFPPSLA